MAILTLAREISLKIRATALFSQQVRPAYARPAGALPFRTGQKSSLSCDGAGHSGAPGV
ncbi:MAG: hypothetical protein ACOY2B_14555 [Pseudomonadota bacterium]